MLDPEMSKFKNLFESTESYFTENSAWIDKTLYIHIKKCLLNLKIVHILVGAEYFHEYKTENKQFNFDIPNIEEVKIKQEEKFVEMNKSLQSFETAFKNLYKA